MIKQKWLLALMVLLISGCGHSITLKFRKDMVPGKLNPVTYYTGYAENLNYEKVLIFIRGTGRFPATHDFGMGAEASLFGFAIVYPQKSYLDDEKQYFRHDCRAQRLHDTGAVMDALVAAGAKHILVLADSEGVWLAPEIAARYSAQVCGLICLSGSVIPGDESLRSPGSGLAEPGQMDLQKYIAQIDANPENTETGLYGHSYKFWHSYLHYDPAGDLRALGRPILLINGERDHVDLTRQAGIVRQWQAQGVVIEQKIYPGVGHELGSVSRTMARDILAWAQGHQIIGSGQK